MGQRCHFQLSGSNGETTRQMSGRKNQLSGTVLVTVLNEITRWMSGRRCHRNSLGGDALVSTNAGLSNSLSAFRDDDGVCAVPSFSSGRRLAVSSSSHIARGLAAAFYSSAGCTRVSSPSPAPSPAALKTTNHPYNDCQPEDNQSSMQ